MKLFETRSLEGKGFNILTRVFRPRCTCHCTYFRCKSFYTIATPGYNRSWHLSASSGESYRNTPASGSCSTFLDKRITHFLTYCVGRLFRSPGRKYSISEYNIASRLKLIWLYFPRLFSSISSEIEKCIAYFRIYVTRWRRKIYF